MADYYSRARTVLSRETVRLQPLDRQLRPSGDWRRLVYDTRVEWDPARPGEASISREPISAGGRLGELAASDAECYNLKGVSVEPLAILLPHRQKDYAFVKATGDGDSPAAIFDFKPLQATPPTVKCAATARPSN